MNRHNGIIIGGVGVVVPISCLTNVTVEEIETDLNRLGIVMERVHKKVNCYYVFTVVII